MLENVLVYIIKYNNILTSPTKVSNIYNIPSEEDNIVFDLDIGNDFL